ncbi:ketopantoate reductase family protein [Frondihabitans australicus]|uniref:2-dehydropantoate 2-reductase n=1 Tax=Frondihabitans australicus TaxID=386892 RepID=A0A495IIY2_9MICO|nr:2-dehydropantoate 2-reductase N-terminal domain-containing protein [Frondihabitans australicus]RKR75943.1 2-dehydropantoate 2-reductase [Frondihabitans australicus]
MRILMFGRGVIATIYGSALQAAGHDVGFLVRPGRAAEYGSDVRLDLLDARHKASGRRSRETVTLRLREKLDVDDRFDLVIVSVGHHRLAEAAAFLAPRIGDATVLVFGNVWAEPADAVAPIPLSQVVWGFPQAGGGFGDDGVLHGAVMRAVLLGTGSGDSSRDSTARDAASVARHLIVLEAFERAGFTIRRQDDMRGWLLVHFVADAGMLSQGYRSGSLARMAGDRRAFQEAFRGAGELLPLVEARGVDLRRHRSATMPFRRPGLMGAVAAWASARFALARASLAAHTDPDTAEARALLLDVGAGVARLGLAAPRLVTPPER